MKIMLYDEIWFNYVFYDILVSMRIINLQYIRHIFCILTKNLFECTICYICICSIQSKIEWWVDIKFWNVFSRFFINFQWNDKNWQKIKHLWPSKLYSLLSRQKNWNIKLILQKVNGLRANGDNHRNSNTQSIYYIYIVHS